MESQTIFFRIITNDMAHIWYWYIGKIFCSYTTSDSLRSTDLYDEIYKIKSLARKGKKSAQRHKSLTLILIKMSDSNFC